MAKVKPLPYWEELRKKLRGEHGLTYQFGKAAIAGTFTMEAFHDDCPMPLCVVWFNFCGLDTVQILNSFTFEYVRRSGLRSYLHRKMSEAYPTRRIISGAGTDSGIAWMKAAGYKQCKAGWEYRPKKAKA